MEQDFTTPVKECCEHVLKKYDGVVKAIWVYGSAVHGTMKKGSDVDLMLILDDTNNDISDSRIAEIASDLEEFTKRVQEKSGVSLHFQAPKRLSDWWDLLRSGEPWVFTSMRDLIILYDPSGYVEPINRLLNSGRMSGTHERAHMLIRRAPQRVENAKRIFLEDITSDLLLAMTESAQSTLMFYGVAPPAPRTIGDALEKNFCPKLLEKGYVNIIRDFYEVTRKIDHRELTKLSAKETRVWLEKAKAFIARMEVLFAALEKSKKNQLVEESYREAFDACKAALSKMGVKSTDKTMLKFVETELVGKYLPRSYLEIIRKIQSLKDAKDSGKIDEMTEKEIYSSRIYAKNLRMILEGVRNENGKNKKTA
ncbi:MAG: nucleotidyltransferase domain-containing protein [Candidatus Aenigmatarchaeota archaeon]